jgi:hypothetical protein
MVGEEDAAEEEKKQESDGGGEGSGGSGGGGGSSSEGGGGGSGGGSSGGGSWFLRASFSAHARSLHLELSRALFALSCANAATEHHGGKSPRTNLPLLADVLGSRALDFCPSILVSRSCSAFIHSQGRDLWDFSAFDFTCVYAALSY